MTGSPLEREALAHLMDWSRPLEAGATYDCPYGAYSWSLAREELAAGVDVTLALRPLHNVEFVALEFAVSSAGPA